MNDLTLFQGFATAYTLTTSLPDLTQLSFAYRVIMWAGAFVVSLVLAYCIRKGWQVRSQSEEAMDRLLDAAEWKAHRYSSRPSPRIIVDNPSCALTDRKYASYGHHVEEDEAL